MTPATTLRSALFVPGTRVEVLPKADAAKPDAVILDLEDAVPVQGKAVARVSVAAALRARTDRLTLVRINHPSQNMVEDDVASLAPHDLQAIVLPKVESVADVEIVDHAIAAFEKSNGLADHVIGLILVIESALGLRVLFDALRASQRICGAALATAEEGDLLADVGGRWTPEGEALSYSRGKFVCDTRAARIPWLLDGAFMALDNDAALDRESRLARTYGFTGKIAVHPRQVATINSAFAPTTTEIERARRMLDAFRAAEARGLAAIKFEGMMVDYANAKIAEQLLSKV